MDYKLPGTLKEEAAIGLTFPQIIHNLFFIVAQSETLGDTVFSNF